jgi:predicted Na+-dependent transporter
MPIAGPIPEQLLTLVAAATVFAVMFDLGLGIVPREFRWVLQHPGLLLRGLFAVLVAVPVLALVLVRAFDLPRGVEIGIVLMAISPGAPVALRRSLGAGGHRAFAPALQILVATLAVVSMPLSIAALNHLYSGHASLAPREVARQVFIAQLLPLGVGIAVRRFAPGLATLLLVVLLALVMIDIAPVILTTRTGAAIAIVALTALAALTGHALGGPHHATRTAVGICAAARNPGLALLVATLNSAPTGVVATVFAYLVISALTLVPYVAFSRRGRGAQDAAPP